MQNWMTDSPRAVGTSFCFSAPILILVVCAKGGHLLGLIFNVVCEPFSPGISFFSTYSFSRRTSTSDAKVEGRPMPFFSSSRMRVASVKREEAFVLFGAACIDFHGMSLPTSRPSESFHDDVS